MKPFKFIPNIQPLLRFGLAFLAAGWVAAGIAPDSMGQGGDALREADREFERMERTIDAEFENIDREWEALVREQREEWERLRREIEALWDSYVPSNRVRWVDHSGSKEARSQVDFEKGEVKVEALAEAGQSPEEARREIQRKIGTRLKEILQKEKDEPSPLRDQLNDRSGNSVTAQTAQRYAERQVYPRVRVRPRPRRSRDGKHRYHGSVTISLIPRHLKKRASRYTDRVRAMADRSGVDPARVMAIIHTESAFNPKAVSRIPAYGLMQLVPRSGAHDAYLHLYGKKRILRASYLYNPGNNIRLGTTYFMLIKRNYLRRVQREPHNTYLAIASYNWGIGNIRRSILRRYNMQTLDGDQLLQIIDRRAPDETRNYIKRINRRARLYESFFQPN
ncbi:MAG TPA: hypothetical protein DDZ83_00200 [Nitrospinae bacterium]|nr:hypothetical protein [Nitrospinota bacterium]